MKSPPLEGIPLAHTPDTALCGRIGVAEEAISVLESQGWRARHDTPRVKLPQSMEDWQADPLQDRNWTYQLHAWRPVDPYIVAHYRLGEASLLHRAAALMLSWREAEAEAGSDEAGLFWNDMGSGLRAAKLGYLLSHAPSADLSPEVYATLVDMARQHRRKLMEPSFLGSSNHAFFQIHGLMALAEALPDDAAPARAYAHKSLEALLHQQFGVEGMHLEHSPGYHLFATRTLRRLLGSGWYDAHIDTKALLKKADTAFRWLVFPDGHLPAVGDTQRGGARRYAYKPVHGEPARLFREAGYAVVRSEPGLASGDAMLFVSASHHSPVHKHGDDLSFELYDRGRYWIVDTGKYSYSRLDWRAFTDSARAHNTLVYSSRYENNGVKRSSPRGGGLIGLTRDGSRYIVDGRVERPLLGVVHDRRFVYEPGVSLVIEDRLGLDREDEVWHWLHLAPDLVAAQDGFGWTAPGLSIGYEVEGSTVADLHRVRGQNEPELQGWMAEGYHRATPNDALGLRLKGRSMLIRTTLRFHDNSLAMHGAAVHSDSENACLGERGGAI